MHTNSSIIHVSESSSNSLIRASMFVSSFSFPRRLLAIVLYKSRLTKDRAELSCCIALLYSAVDAIRLRSYSGKCLHLISNGFGVDLTEWGVCRVRSRRGMVVAARTDIDIPLIRGFSTKYNWKGTGFRSSRRVPMACWCWSVRAMMIAFKVNDAFLRRSCNEFRTVFEPWRSRALFYGYVLLWWRCLTSRGNLWEDQVCLICWNVMISWCCSERFGWWSDIELFLMRLDRAILKLIRLVNYNFGLNSHVRVQGSLLGGWISGTGWLNIKVGVAEYHRP